MRRTFLLIIGALSLVCLLIVWPLQKPTQSPPPQSEAKPESPQQTSLKDSRWAKDAVVTEDSAPVSVEQMLEDAIAEIENNTNALSFEYRASRFQEIVNGISTNDFAAAFAKLVELQSQNPTDTGRELQLRLLQRWSETDVRAAAQTLAQVRTEDRAEACERVATVWARDDFKEAVSWAQQLPESGDRQNALLAIAYETASTNPKEALTLVSQLTVPPEKRDLITQAASAWASDAPEAAAAWAQQIQDPSLRDQTLAAIATSWADKNPTGAAQLVLDSISAGQTQDNAVIGILQRLASKDEAGATAWASQFPEGPRETALAELKRISERRRLIESPK